MNFLSLQYFLAVATEKNFSVAANKLFVSQQSISEQIKKLETEIGTPLLLRKRPLELTEAGRIFAEGAKRIIAERDRTIAEIANSVAQRNQLLMLAISPFEAPPMLSKLMTFFKEIHPNVNLEVVKRQKYHLPDEMTGISFYFDFPPLNPDMDQVFFIRNDFSVVTFRQSLLKKCYPDDWECRLESLKQTGNLALVKNLPFILLKNKEGKLSQYASALFSSFDMEPVIGFQSDNGDLNSTYCLQGGGAMIGSFFYERCRFESVLLAESEDPLILVPLRTKRNSLPIAVSYIRGHQFTAIENSFLITIRTCFAEISESFEGTPYDIANFSADLFY